MALPYLEPRTRMPSKTFWQWLCLMVISIALTKWSQTPPKCHAGPAYYSNWFPRPLWSQYTSWYPGAASSLANISEQCCHQTLEDYHQALVAPTTSTDSHYLLSLCYKHTSCLLHSLPPKTLHRLQQTTHLLGAMPGLLWALGPNVMELGLLSAHRPVLSFLISIGAPTVSSLSGSRWFAHNHVTSALDLGAETRAGRLLKNRMGGKTSIAVSLAQYLLAMTAVVNVIMTSIEIGQKTVLSWACTTQFLPLLWAALPCVVNIAVGVSYRLPLARLERLGPGVDAAETQNPKSQQPTSLPASLESRHALRPNLLDEVTVCANQHCECLGGTAYNSRSIFRLNFAAGIFGIIHLLFGMVVFSSLELVMYGDVLKYILGRYLLSVLACRLIVFIELRGISRHETRTKTNIEPADMDKQPT